MNNETGNHNNVPKETPCRIIQIIDDMALAGEKEFYDDSPKDLDDALIETYLWRKVALAMLKSVKFPAELYRLCHDIACMNDEKLEDLIAKGKEEG